MKLLAWMQQKLCLSSNDQRKNFDGNASFALHAQPINKQLKLKNKVEGNWMEDALKDDLFHGFLAIGTLGSDPPTPTFTTTPSRDIATEMELVNSELQMFISADADEEISNQVSSPRNSMQQNSADSEDFPLQNYLSGAGLVVKEHKQSCAVKFLKKLPKLQVPKIKFFPRQVHPDRPEEMALASYQSLLHRAETKECSETIYTNRPAENSERWITTEDDYLVLELQTGNSQRTLGGLL